MTATTVGVPPPVEGLDYEMDCRGVALEHRIGI